MTIMLTIRDATGRQTDVWATGLYNELIESDALVAAVRGRRLASVIHLCHSHIILS